jgi:iduronate 2-sulfatase
MKTLILLLAATACAAAGRPNVLLLYIDDLKPMTRDYGESHMRTPNFDRLAAAGIRFEQAYCQVPTCGASRASLMTSRYPTVKRFPDFKCRAGKDAPDAPTLPQRFREAGYVTVSNGKVFHHKDDTAERSWSEPPWRPRTTGRTFHNRETARFMETSTAMRRLPNGQQAKKVPMFEKSRIDPMESHDGLIARRTMDDLERLAGGDRPFFIACGFAKPHMPFYAPESAWQPYRLPEIGLAPWRGRPDPAPRALRQVREQFSYVTMNHALTRRLPYNKDLYHRHMRQGYYACVTHADDLTGRILDKLEQLGLAENTVVVVLGDHGWLLGEHDEWAKNQLLPEALRTALWMRGPGIARGGAAGTFVEFVDIHPTLCELAGIAIDAGTIDGRSFAAVLRDPDAPHRDHAYTRFGPGDAITTASHYYARWDTPEHGIERLLIDLGSDPLGKRNLAADPSQQERIGELDRKLDAKIQRARR